MSKQEVEAIITELWKRWGMEDHSGMDKVRDELEDLLIRTYEAGRDGSHVGTLSNVRVFSRALTAPEIHALNKA